MAHRMLVVVSCLLLVFVSVGHTLDLPVLPHDHYLWTTFTLTAGEDVQTTFIEAVNQQGDLLGWATTGATDQQFVIQHGQHLRNVPCPNAPAWSPASLNASGVIVGSCVPAMPTPDNLLEGMVLFPPETGRPPLSFPLNFAQETYIADINDRGEFVGTWGSDTAGYPNSFKAKGLAPGNSDGGPIFTLIAVIPGQDVAATALQALNNQEGLVGYYYARVATPDGGRLQKRGLFLWFDRYWDWTVPGTEETLLWDINDAFAVVGVARDVEGSAAVYRDPATGEWFEIVPPAPWIYIDVTSINNAGQLAGRMGADDPARPGFILWSGFLATPKPPEMLPQGQAVAQAQNLRGLSRSQPQVAQRPRLRLVADGCTEGHGEFVPLKLRAALGCDR